MSDETQKPEESASAEPQVPLNRAERRALAAGKGKTGNTALNKSTANPGLNRAAVPPAQRIQTRGAGRGK